MTELLERTVGERPDADRVPVVCVAALRSPDGRVERLALLEGVAPGTFLVALDLTRARNRRLLGGVVELVREGRGGEPLVDVVRVTSPTSADLEHHRALAARLFPPCRGVRPSDELTVLRLEVLDA